MAASKMGNPGLAPRAHRDLLCLGWSHGSLTASDLRAQTLAARYCLSPWMAQDMALLCYGEGRSDD